MKIATKSILIVILGYVIYFAIIYFSLSFLNLDLNITRWSRTLRGVMLFLISVYAVASPMIYSLIKDEFK